MERVPAEKSPDGNRGEATMSGSQKIGFGDLSRLERLELEEYLKSWNGGAAWRTEPAEFREERPGANTLGQVPDWICLLPVASAFLPAIARWLVERPRTIVIKSEATKRDGTRDKKEIVVKGTSPGQSAKDAKKIEKEAQEIEKQIRDAIRKLDQTSD
jgi:hypothetical protein